MTPNQVAQFLPAFERIATSLDQILLLLAHPLREVPADATAHTHAEPTRAPVTVATAPTAAQESIPYDTVRVAVNAYADAHGEHAAQAVIKSFGATYIKDLKATPEKYADVLAALK